MVNKNNLIFSIAAAQRILNIKSGIYQVQEWAWCVWVRGKNFCKFFSKKVFYKHFANYRKEQSKEVDIIQNPQDENEFTAISTSNLYKVEAQSDRVICECEDYKNQSKFIGTGICKHGYAAISILGFETLQSYLDARKTYKKFDPFKDAPVSLSNGARKSGEPRRKGRSVD